MMDIQHRQIWSLSTGKLLDECNVGDVPDEYLHRKLQQADNIRVNITMRNALELFERKGP